MAALGHTFDSSTVAPAEARAVLPPGDYVAQIVRSEMKENSKRTGSFLEIELDIMDGAHAGKKLWDRMNLVNTNQQAADIAARTLSAICHSTGQITVSDSDQLHFKPMLVKVAVRPAGPDKGGVLREAQNEVKGYSATNGARPAAGAGVAHAASAGAGAAAGGGKAPPWRRAS